MGKPEEEHPARHREVPLQLIVAICFIGLIGMHIGIGNYNKNRGIDTNRQSSFAAEFDDESSGSIGVGSEQTTTTQDNSLPGTIDTDGMVTLINGTKGRYNPYTKIFYPLVASPSDLPGYLCFEVLDGATAYGSLLVGGESTYTMSDVESAVFIKDGVRYGIDPDIDPTDWKEEVWHVKRGDLGCTYNQND